MKLRIVATGAVIVAAAFWASSFGALGADTEIVFHDDFSAMEVGMVSAGVIGAEAEYHYFPETAPHGNWEVSCFRSEASQRAWRVIREDGFGRKLMLQASTSTRAESAYTHPILVAGDPLWGDYTLSVIFAPESKENWSGAVFRYRNDRCLYFFGVKEDKACLFLLNHGTGFRQVSAQDPGGEAVRLHTRRGTDGGRRRQRRIISGASLPNGLVLEADDSTFPQGRIGLLADVPTRFTAGHGDHVP